MYCKRNIYHPSSSFELFPDCLKIQVFIYLLLFAIFYDQQGIQRAYSSDGTPGGMGAIRVSDYFI